MNASTKPSASTAGDGGSPGRSNRSVSISASVSTKPRQTQSVLHQSASTPRKICDDDSIKMIDLIERTLFVRKIQQIAMADGAHSDDKVAVSDYKTISLAAKLRLHRFSTLQKSLDNSQNQTADGNNDKSIEISTSIGHSESTSTVADSIAADVMEACSVLCEMSIATKKCKQKQVRDRLQQAAESILTADDDSKKYDDIGLYTACLVFIGLSLRSNHNAIDKDSVRSSCRAVASAFTHSVLSSRRCQSSSDLQSEAATSPNQLSIDVVEALLESAVSLKKKDGDDDNIEPYLASTAKLDLHVVVAMMKALEYTQSYSPVAEEAAVVLICECLLIDREASKPTSTVDAFSTIMPTSLPNVAEQRCKISVAAGLGLACQVAPWKILSPMSVVVAAMTPLYLWNTSERICDSVLNLSQTRNLKSDGSAEEDACTQNIVNMAIETTQYLIDRSMDARMYRQSDVLATKFYDSAGPCRFLEARYQHACSTIVAVIRKGAAPIVEIQIQRVDEAVARVQQAIDTEKASFTTVNSILDIGKPVQDPQTNVATASDDVRHFALRQLETSGQLDVAQRLATLWGMDYVYDKEKIQEFLRIQRETYLQWDDVLDGAEVPLLVSTPEELIDQFRCLNEQSNSIVQGDGAIGSKVLFGFDVEWGDEANKGASLLQLAAGKRAILVDIPALSTTSEGATALQQTIGELFARSDALVVGFSCRQDVTRLRNSPCANAQHWLGPATAVVDLQTEIGKVNPPLGPYGLSRCSHFYLGKPLNKSEQCSLWSKRPLSMPQRVYASLDAVVCALMYTIVATMDDKESAQKHNNKKHKTELST